MFYHNG
jgi:chaperone BCS1